MRGNNLPLTTSVFFLPPHHLLGQTKTCHPIPATGEKDCIPCDAQRVAKYRASLVANQADSAPGKI